jgi:hypothetical protein
MQVIIVLACIVEERLIAAIADLDDVDKVLVLETGALEELVAVLYVSEVVLIVVILQRLGRHVRLQGVIGVWKFI